MAHSQTPWPMPIYDNHGNGGFSEWWEISGIARVYSQEDAEFILRAVNCHDELLSALLAVVGLTTASDLGADLEARVEAIIAKAEAK